jgi:hypothetical protein
MLFGELRESLELQGGLIHSLCGAWLACKSTSYALTVLVLVRGGVLYSTVPFARSRGVRTFV